MAGEMYLQLDFISAILPYHVQYWTIQIVQVRPIVTKSNLIQCLADVTILILQNSNSYRIKVSLSCVSQGSGDIFNKYEHK